MRRKTLFVFALLAMLSGKARSQSDTLAFSFDQALAYADEHAYQAKSAGYDIEASRKKVWEYLAMGMPQVNAFAGLTDNLTIQTSVFSMSVDGGAPSTIKAQFGQQYTANAGISASQLLFDGSYFLGVKASRLVVELTEMQKKNMQVDIRQNTAQAYYLMLMAQHNLDNFEQNLATTEKLLRDEQAYQEQGLREKLDVDQMKLMVAKSRNLVLDAQRQLMVTAATLKFMMGIDLDSPIKLTTTFDDLLAKAKLVNNQDAVFSNSQHVSYQLMEKQEQIQTLKVRNEKVQYLPKINLGYSLTHVRFGDELKFGQMDKTTPQALELKLSMPVFASGMRSARVKQEQINLMKVENEKTALEQNLRRAVLVASENLDSARDKYSNDTESEQISREIYDQTQVKYSHGVSSSTDLSVNQQQYIQSQINAIGSALNLFNAYIDYQKAMGQL